MCLQDLLPCTLLALAHLSSNTLLLIAQVQLQEVAHALVTCSCLGTARLERKLCSALAFLPVEREQLGPARLLRLDALPLLLLPLLKVLLLCANRGGLYLIFNVIFKIISIFSNPVNSLIL